MPRSTFRINLGIGRLRQREMHAPAVAQPRGTVRRGAHERVPNAHPRPDVDQAGAFGGRDGIGANAEVVHRAPEQRGIARWLRRRDEQDESRVTRYGRDARGEALLNAVGQR